MTDSASAITPQVEEEKDKDRIEVGPINKPPYPKTVFLILATEFCERFSFYGMTSILTLYLSKELEFSEKDTIISYHLFSMACYFTPVFGAMIADSLLGRFRTIFYLSMVYVLGHLVHTVAATPVLKIPPIPFSFIGLALIAVGTGGIKPNVAAFGGEQFQVPEQQKELVSFFSVFYLLINIGGLITTFVSPIIRDVSCFGQSTCYSLAFALPALLMIIALIIFGIGRPFYKIYQPTGNVFLKVIKCVAHAISQNWKRHFRNGYGNEDIRCHWMDYAGDEYDSVFIDEVKSVVSVLLLFIPLPAFSALHGQQNIRTAPQKPDLAKRPFVKIFWFLVRLVGRIFGGCVDVEGSRWTLQADRMSRDVFGFTIKPEQIGIVNPVLTLILIPVFDGLMYPLLAKCNLLQKPLQRMTTGGVVAGVAFIVAGILELYLEAADENSVNILWMLPQLFLITISEILFALTGVNFTYTESPASMKSLMQSAWLLTVAVGNIIVVAVAGAQLVDDRANESFLMAGLMFVFMLVFGFMAYRYVPLDSRKVIKLGLGEEINNG